MSTEKSYPQPAPGPVPSDHDYTPYGPWEARCRDVTYKGGDWSRDQFLQWEVYGIDEPPGRGAFHREEALLVSAAPELLAVCRRMVEFAASGAGFAYPLGSLQELQMAVAKATGAQA